MVFLDTLRTSASRRLRILGVQACGVTVLMGLSAAFAGIWTPLEAQSILAAGGLGAPIEGVDSRARSLGSVGIGLSGFSFYHFDPAGAAGARAPLIQASLQPSWGEFTQSDSTQSTHASRFPHLAIGYPVNDNATVLFTYSGVLDQRWRMFSQRDLPLSGQAVTVSDEFLSDGGLAVVNLGWAQRLGEKWAVGATIGYHTGNLVRSLTRTFDAGDLGVNVDPFVQVGTWQISGPAATASVRWDPVPAARIGLGVEWAGDLEISPTNGTTLGGQTAEVPIRFRIGGTGSLTPDLDLMASVSYANWDGQGGSGLGAEARSSAEINYGVGLEFTGFGFLDRTMPLRIGYRHADYPYTFSQSEAQESQFAFGLGYVFAAIDEYALASLDLGAERGKRTAGSLEESFWRATFTLRLSGN
jgi:hypothetical protein